VRWLTIHARDGGFAAFMRGGRDRTDGEWDISAVPADGGLRRYRRPPLVPAMGTQLAASTRTSRPVVPA
jgi:hypothetical protein